MESPEVHKKKVQCVLCKRPEESLETGPLSTKSSVTAHQNCLLYSSGIYCVNTPEHDDLFGFSVEHVQEEARRGRKLKCDGCKKFGATVGCEVKRCTKSFHLPCVIGAGAKTVEGERWTYAVYCKKHSSQNEGGANGVSSADSSDSSTRHSSKMELQTELFKMNPLEELDKRQLREFFRRNKTEMSCMDNPQTFLNQLRDNKLIPEEKYKEMTRITSKDKMKKNLYNLLCWIEEKQPQTISLFWTCVFKEFIMTQYPTLKRLQDSLRECSTSDPNASQAVQEQRVGDGVECCAEIEEDENDQGDNLEEVTDERPRVGQNEFRVICGALSGMLHKSRFASGRCGNSIRTEDRWMSPVEFVEQGSAMPNAPWRRDIQWEGKPLSSLIERKMLQIHSEQCDCPLCHPDPQALEEQKSDDDCFVCGRLGGKMVMCDHCPRSFHQKCHLPQLDPPTLGDDSEWMCTFCIWNMNEYLPRMTYEETLMHPVSNHMLQCHYLLLSLYNADKDHIFAKDPCIHVRGYSSQIVTPMWLDKITELLGQQYTVGQLLTDIQLIFSNCDKFNQNKPEFRDMGIKLKEFYEQEEEKVFRRQ